MDQWPFIVLIVSAVLIAWTNPAIAAAMDNINSGGNILYSVGSNYIAPQPWQSGVSAAVDTFANGVSLFGTLVSTGAQKLLDSTTHGAGVLLSGTLGNRMVNIDTRHHLDMFG